MKKYIVAASLLMLNAEVLSWIVLAALAVMGVIDFAKAVDREREAQKWTE